MQVYHVEQRQVKADIYTRMGWLKATFHIGRRHSFIDTINQTPGFFRLTEVTLPGEAEELPFFALQRDQTMIILPDDTHLIESARKSLSEEVHKAKCLLEMGTVRGEIRILPNTRMSDYLVHQGGFFLMHNCEGDFCENHAGKTGSGHARYAIINSHSVIGVAE